MQSTILVIFDQIYMINLRFTLRDAKYNLKKKTRTFLSVEIAKRESLLSAARAMKDK